MKFLEKGSLAAARELIGWRLYALDQNGQRVGGVIVETEAYSQEDAASHSYRGKTPRTEVMFGPPGYIYVYFTYGMHWCMNIVTGLDGYGEAVLIRAIKPDAGIEIMRKRRNLQPDHLLVNGPAKVCQALAITGVDNGTRLNSGKILLLPPHQNTIYTIQATPRIGITKDIHRLWRFVAEL